MGRHRIAKSEEANLKGKGGQDDGGLIQYIHTVDVQNPNVQLGKRNKI